MARRIWEEGCGRASCFCSLDGGAKRTRFPLRWRHISRNMSWFHQVTCGATCTWHVGERGAHTPPVYIYSIHVSTRNFYDRCIPYSKVCTVSVHTHFSAVCKLKTETFICGMYKNYFPSKYEGTVPTSPQPPPPPPTPPTTTSQTNQKKHGPLKNVLQWILFGPRSTLWEI